MTAFTTKLDVTVADAEGAVTVKTADLTYTGVISAPPPALKPGQQLDMTLEPEGASPFDGVLEVVGKVDAIDGADSRIPNTPIFAGLSFTFEVTRMTRSAGVAAAEGDDEAQLVGGAVEGRIESKVFKRSPVIAQLDAVNQGEGGDTIHTPPPLMSFADDDEPEHTGETDAPVGEVTGVIGTLKQVSLAEVVQGLELGRKTARISVHPAEGPRGKVFVIDGGVVHAEVSGLEGDEAFYNLARVSNGTYRIRFGRRPQKTTVEKPTAFLILEAMRRIDEEQEYGVVEATSEGGPVPSREEPPEPELSLSDEQNERSHSSERIPTGVRESVVGALERAFQSAKDDDEQVIAVDEELVIEEQVEGGQTEGEQPGPEAVAAEPAVLSSESAPVTAEHAPTLKGTRRKRKKKKRKKGAGEDNPSQVFSGFFQEAKEDSGPRLPAPGGRESATAPTGGEAEGSDAEGGDPDPVAAYSSSVSSLRSTKAISQAM